MRKGQSRGQLLEPIVRWETTGDGEETLLMDTRALMMHLGVGDRTVRRYKDHRVKHDEVTGAPLYDALAIGAERLTVQTRTRTGRPALRMAT